MMARDYEGGLDIIFLQMRITIFHIPPRPNLDTRASLPPRCSTRQIRLCARAGCGDDGTDIEGEGRKTGKGSAGTWRRVGGELGGAGEALLKRGMKPMKEKSGVVGGTRSIHSHRVHFCFFVFVFSAYFVW